RLAFDVAITHAQHCAGIVGDVFNGMRQRTGWRCTMYVDGSARDIVDTNQVTVLVEVQFFSVGPGPHPQIALPDQRTVWISHGLVSGLAEVDAAAIGLYDLPTPAGMEQPGVVGQCPTLSEHG